jgi:uncharacterized protein (DUF433 family)
MAGERSQIGPVLKDLTLLFLDNFFVWLLLPLEVIVKNRDILGGTSVAIQTLFDYLEGRGTLEDFLKGFPTVSRESAVAALEEAKRLLLARP